MKYWIVSLLTYWNSKSRNPSNIVREKLLRDWEKLSLRRLFCSAMTDLEQYLHSYFTFDSDDLVKVSLLFKPAILNKGDYFLKAGNSATNFASFSPGSLGFSLISMGER